MKRKNLKMMTAIALALVMLVSALAGCGVTTDSEGPRATNLAAYGGGVLRLKVNPELGITYDENGNVVDVEARNDDGEKILADFTGYEGKDAAQVIRELVEIMGNAGFFVDEIEGQGQTGRQITIEVEDGSKLPKGLTMQDVVDEVTECVESHHWAGVVVLDDEELYDLDDRHGDADDDDDEICDVCGGHHDDDIHDVDDDDDDICPVCGEKDCDIHDDDDDDDEICDVCGGHHDDDIHDVDDADDDDDICPVCGEKDCDIHDDDDDDDEICNVCGGHHDDDIHDVDDVDDDDDDVDDDDDEICDVCGGHHDDDIHDKEHCGRGKHCGNGKHCRG